MLRTTKQFSNPIPFVTNFMIFIIEKHITFTNNQHLRGWQKQNLNIKANK